MYMCVLVMSTPNIRGEDIEHLFEVCINNYVAIIATSIYVYKNLIYDSSCDSWPF